ncbi:MAG: STAS domain-containing protein [Gammaproteobacteria bacterium]|nr:STAS domain-containing protein [Gammaproteobacteria bacterium]
MLNSKFLPEKQAFKVKIHGEFNLPMALHFRKAYLEHESSKHSNNTNHYVIDLSETSNIDSAAIGSLLLWSDYMAMKNPETGLYLINANQYIKSVFEAIKIESHYKNIKLH